MAQESEKTLLYRERKAFEGGSASHPGMCMLQIIWNFQYSLVISELNQPYGHSLLYSMCHCLGTSVTWYSIDER